MFLGDGFDRMTGPTRTPQDAPAAARGRRKVDIEQLLQWAFLDELPKRQISSAEGIWDRMAQYGSLGGVNPDVSHFAGGGAQRYAQFGLPHPDAEAIEKAVAALGSTAVDWEAHREAIVGELAGLIDVNELTPAPATPPDRGRAHHAGYYDRDGGAPVRDARRHTLLIASINLTALVQRHAIFRSRPDWRHDELAALPVHAGRGFAIVGECRGKNLYADGSYCPLTWSPSPLSIVLDRADYFLWHQALTTLADTLKLSAHEATKPAASPAPWREPEILHRTYKQEADPKMFSLREVQRPRAGPPLRFSIHSKDRRPLLDSGE